MAYISITLLVRFLSQEIAKLLSSKNIHRYCKKIGHKFRNRKLNPAKTVHSLIAKILNRNASYAQLPHITHIDVTDDAFRKAFKRLPLELINYLAAQVAFLLSRQLDPTRYQTLGEFTEPGGGAGYWHGRRVIMADSTTCSMPDTKDLAQAYGYPQNKHGDCNFPQSKLLFTIDFQTRAILQLIPRSNDFGEQGFIPMLHQVLQPGDIFVGDRGFCSFAHFVYASQHGVFILTRLHASRIVCFSPNRPQAPKKGCNLDKLPRSRWISCEGIDDQIVEWERGKYPTWLTKEQFKALPDRIQVRELRYRVNFKGFRSREITLATTLLDAKAYPKEDLAELYFHRWQVETDLRSLKRTLNMEILRSKSQKLIIKELALFHLTYNLTRAATLKVARLRDVPVKQVSFIGALAWMTTTRDGSLLNKVTINPVRKGRSYPRKQKRRNRAFPAWTGPRLAREPTQAA